MTLVRGARMALVDLNRSSMTADSATDPNLPATAKTANLYANVAGLDPGSVKRIRELTVEFHAALLSPTAMWSNVPLAIGRSAAPGLTAYRGRNSEAWLTSVTVGTDVGASVRPARSARQVVTVELRESLHSASESRLHVPPAAQGLLEVVAAGTQPAGEVYACSGTMGNYATSRAAGGSGRLPDRVNIRFFSSSDVSRAMKPYRFVFSGLRFSPSK